MKVVNTEFDFTYQRRKYHAHLSMFTPVSRLMFRVWLRLNDNKEQVFVFYKMEKNQLFWFDLQDEYKQGMATAIAGMLLE
ncbi:MAG: hypothetical protein V4539_01145 [Bacteroidota bacterium]